MKKLLIPIILPAIGLAFILTFSRGLGEFTAQAFLGLHVRFYTISTQIYSIFSNRLLHALSLVLISIAALTVYFNNKVIGVRKKFTTIQGKGVKRKLILLLYECCLKLYY